MAMTPQDIQNLNSRFGLSFTPSGGSPMRAPGLTSRSVQTYRVDNNGNPIMRPAARALDAIDQAVPRLPSSAPGLPANYGASSAYMPDPNAIARTRTDNGDYSEPMRAADMAPALPPPQPDVATMAPQMAPVAQKVGALTPATPSPVMQMRRPVKTIQTANNGQQIVGQRLNNSNRGMTVTGDNWFNSVRGL